MSHGQVMGIWSPVTDLGGVKGQPRKGLTVEPQEVMLGVLLLKAFDLELGA